MKITAVKWKPNFLNEVFSFVTSDQIHSLLYIIYKVWYVYKVLFNFLFQKLKTNRERKICKYWICNCGKPCAHQREPKGLESIVKQDIVVEKCLLLSANPRSKMSHALSIVLQGLTLSVFTMILLALGFKRISFLSWLHFIIKWLNAFSRWHGIFHVYLFIYLIIIYKQLKKKEFIRYKKFQYND